MHLHSSFFFSLRYFAQTAWLTNVLTADIYLVDHRVDVCASTRINLTLDVLLLLSPKDLPHFSQRGWQQNQQSHYFINIMHKLNWNFCAESISMDDGIVNDRLNHDHSCIVVICTCIIVSRRYKSTDLLNQLQ